MNAEFRQRERELDRQLAAIAPHLDAPAPGEECIAHLRQAVDQEAQRLGRRRKLLVRARPWLGAAAALLLAVGLSLPTETGTHAPPVAAGDNPDEAFTNWVDALGESGEQFTRLLDDNWLLNASGTDGGENGEVVDPFDSLEESLQAFERMTEA